MGNFIQSNIIWFTPIITIILTIVIKISAKPDFVALGIIDYFDFGFDLAISTIIILLTNIKDNTGIWLLCGSFMLMMIVAILVNRLGWNRYSKEENIFGVLLPDFFSIFLLVIVSLYVGGVIR